MKNEKPGRIQAIGIENPGTAPIQKRYKNDTKTIQKRYKNDTKTIQKNDT
jgi:hypothetical protein